MIVELFWCLVLPHLFLIDLFILVIERFTRIRGRRTKVVARSLAALVYAFLLSALFRMRWETTVFCKASPDSAL